MPNTPDQDREDLTQALADLRLAEQAIRRVTARIDSMARLDAWQAELHCDRACRSVRRALDALDS